MTVPVSQSGSPPRRLPRSIAAVVAGFLTVGVLSVAVDQLLHVLDVYPPWGQPMHDPWLNLLALSYRVVITVFGGYLTARLAPHSPVRHALILGAIGFIASLAGAIGTMGMNLGPRWYPFALVLTAVPCTWLGGKLYARTTRP